MRENLNDVANASNNQNTEYAVKFFSLKAGEKAIVRILVDNEADLNPYTYHEVTSIEGYTKRVDCMRTIRDDVSKCPLCAAGNPTQRQSYIHLLQYTPNNDGTMSVEAKTWGRTPSKSAKGIVGQILEALKEYGPLSQYVSTISRTGTTREDTTYSLKINVPEGVYGPAANYPLKKELFEGYSEEGTIIKQWTVDEANGFLSTGSLPKKAETQNFDPATAKPAYQNVPNNVNDNNLPFNTAPQQQQMYQQPVQQQFNAAPVQNEGLPFGDGNVGNPAQFGAGNFSTPVQRYQ